jgi:hypothetical protein
METISEAHDRFEVLCSRILCGSKLGVQDVLSDQKTARPDSFSAE